MKRVFYVISKFFLWLATWGQKRCKDDFFALHSVTVEQHELTMLADLPPIESITVDAARAHMILSCFARMTEECFKDKPDAKNYMEFRYNSPLSGPLSVILCRHGGKSPHQIREDLERENEALKVQIRDLLGGATE